MQDIVGGVLVLGLSAISAYVYVSTDENDDGWENWAWGAFWVALFFFVF